MLLLFSRRFLLVVFGCLLYLLFSRWFCWFSKNLRENQTSKNTKPISKGGSETFKHFVLCCFPEGVFVFFGCLLYLLFSRMFVCFLKTFGKTKQTKKTNPYPRVCLKPLKLWLFGFPEGFFVFSLVFFCIFGFPDCLFVF